MLKNNSRYYLNKFQAQTYNFIAKVSPEMETLGELIRRRMNDVGIKSNSELARRIGKSAAYVGDLVNDTAKTQSGTYKPSPEVVAKLSDVLQIPEIEILNAIGYLSEKRSGDTHDILDIATVSFHGTKISKKNQQKLLDAMRLIAEGVKAQAEQEEKEKEQEE